MSTAEPSSTEATQIVVWAMNTLASVVGVDLDPLQTQRLARASLEGRARFDREELKTALKTALEGSRLVPADAVNPEDSLEQIELPLVSVGGLALRSRRPGVVEVSRPEEAPTWLTLAAARDAMKEVGGPWLTAAPATPLEAAAHHASPWQRLRAFLHLERDDLWVIFVYAAAVGAFTLATPIAVQSLVSSVAFGTVLQPIVVLSLLLLAALGFQGTLRALQTRVVESVQQRLFVRAALDLAWRLPRVKTEAEVSPESVNRFFEVVTLQKTAGVLLTDGVATVLQIAIGLLVLGFYHPALLAFDLVLIVLLAVVVWAPARRGLETSLDESAAKYDVAAWLQELARPTSTFRAQGGAAFAAERADALTRRYLDARDSHFKVLFGQTLGTLALQVFASAALLGLGGWLVVQRELTLGQLVAAELIVAAVTGSVAKLGKLLDSTYDLLTGLEKLGHLLEVELEDSDQGEPVPGQGGIRVEVRGPLSLDVAAAERVALLGPRSDELAESLAALRLPAEGSISFNGVETTRARAPRLREDVALVRAGELFEGTVLENVTVGRAGVTALDARSALERVGLLEEVRALPAGLDTQLSGVGAPLSPAQRLRLLVARALAGTPRLIVVDASFEGLTAEERARCVSALTRPAAPWTLIALAPEPGDALAKACARQLPLLPLKETTS